VTAWQQPATPKSIQLFLGLHRIIQRQNGTPDRTHKKQWSIPIKTRSTGHFYGIETMSSISTNSLLAALNKNYNPNCKTTDANITKSFDWKRRSPISFTWCKLTKSRITLPTT
jgi:hypothetical protein